MNIIKVDPDGRCFVVFTAENGRIMAHLIQDGRVVESREVAVLVKADRPINHQVVVALAKAALATVAVMALISGHPEIALILVYLLRAIDA